MIQKIKTFFLKNNEKIVLILAGIVIILLIHKIFTINEETRIINKLENYRQKVEVLNKNIEKDLNSLKDKVEQKYGILQLMECELNQLKRLGEGLEIENNYCSSNSFSFIPKTYADENEKDLFEIQHNNWIQEEIEIQRKIRLERLNVCEDALINSGIDISDIYISELPNKTNHILHCATMMTLVYAFESNFGISRMCLEDKNCYGMRGNGIDTPAGNLKFDTFLEGSEYFARKFYEWHYKKSIRTFVYDWAEGNREEYIYFIESKYEKVYDELSSLFY